MKVILRYKLVEIININEVLTDVHLNKVLTRWIGLNLDDEINLRNTFC
jgi:hypothetical protein